MESVGVVHDVEDEPRLVPHAAHQFVDAIAVVEAGEGAVEVDVGGADSGPVFDGVPFVGQVEGLGDARQVAGGGIESVDTGAFDDAPADVQLGDVLGGGHADEDAAVEFVRDEPVFDEDLEGLAHGVAGDVEGGADVGFGQSRAWSERSVDDRVPQNAGDPGGPAGAFEQAAVSGQAGMRIAAKGIRAGQVHSSGFDLDRNHSCELGSAMSSMLNDPLRVLQDR
nr:hypothetical protein JVH1_4602 [Rhodococcus sp. JVH1]